MRGGPRSRAASMQRAQRSNYKLSDTPVEVPRCWKVVFFICVQLPGALLWVANAVLNVVVIRYFWRPDTIVLCVGLGLGAAACFVMAAGHALYRVFFDGQRVEAWLGFHPFVLLIPPSPLFFPVLLWLRPFPGGDPRQYRIIEEVGNRNVAVNEEIGDADAAIARAFVSTDVVEMVNPLTRESLPTGQSVEADPMVGSDSDSVEGTPEHFAPRLGYLREPSPLGERSEGAEMGSDEFRIPSVFESIAFMRDDDPRWFDHFFAPSGPPETRTAEATTLPHGLKAYRAVQELEEASLASGYWALLWGRYRTKLQFISWGCDSHLNVWHLVFFAAGTLRASRDPTSFNDSTLTICIAGLLVKVAYFGIVARTTRCCCDSFSRADGVRQAAFYAHDVCSNTFSLFLCGTFGYSIFNSLNPANEDDAKRLHSFGFNGLAAFKAIQTFVWIQVSSAALGFVLTTILFVNLSVVRLSRMRSVCQKIRELLALIFCVAVVIPHQQLMRILTPSVLYSMNEPQGWGEVDCGAFLRLFHFVTDHADAAVRAKRVYFLLREELCDRIDDRWHEMYHQQPPFSFTSEGDSSAPEPRNEESVPPIITKLLQLLSQRPITARTIEENYAEESSETWKMHDNIMVFAEKLNLVGSFIQFAFPFLFVPTLSAHWLMLTLFAGKCVTIVVIALLTPAARSYARLRREIFPVATSLSCPTKAGEPSFVMFRWIARYFQTVDVPFVTGVQVPTHLLPIDIRERVGQFLHPSDLVVPPEVDGDRFEEEYAADPYDLPLWDGRMPKRERKGSRWE